MNNQKGRDRTRKKNLLLHLLVFSTFWAGIFLLSMFFSFTDSSAEITSPLYEEIYLSSDGLSEKIKKIDYSIYDSLYQSGVQEQDVFFLNVQPRHKDGYVWDFAELLVKCSDRDKVVSIYKKIDHDLAALGAEIRLGKEKGAGGKIICNVFVKSVRTHRIVLRVDNLRLSVQDVRPKLAIIVDDLGYNSDTNFLFFKLNIPLSLSILPYGPVTRSIVQKANKDGVQLLLHLPMEAKNCSAAKLGPGGLYLSMDANKIRRVLDQDLRQIIGVCGVNNHMGSSFTENREKMLVVLNELKKRNLFFVDSRTTKETVALELARDIGLPAARRRVFLDNNLDSKSLNIQMERFLNMARHRGVAIGICHPYKETYLLLKRYQSKIKSEFQIVPVSELVH